MMAHANKKGNTRKEKHRFNPGAILGTALLVKATGQIDTRDTPYPKLSGWEDLLLQTMTFKKLPELQRRKKTA